MQQRKDLILKFAYITTHNGGIAMVADAFDHYLSP